MLADILVLFIVVVIISLILSVYTMEDNPMLAIVFVTIGMVFSVLCTYGMWNIEYFYTGYNASEGNTTGYIYSTSGYGDPYSYIFFLLFWVFVVLFFKTGFNMWRDALKTKGEINYNIKDKRWK